MYVKQRVRSVERVNTSGLFKAANTFLPGGERRGAESNTENDKKKGGYAVEGRVQRQSVISGASGSTLRVANRVEER